MPDKKTTLSAILLTLNEETNIGRCLENLGWVDEIILVDSGSSDKTKELASRYTVKVFDLRWEGFGKAKEYAMSKASGEWILSVDADEVVSDDLKNEILSKISSSDMDGYFIPRRSNFLGKWIKNGGWYPDYVLRLFRADKAFVSSDVVHEKVIVHGKVEYLKNEIKHYTDPNLHHYLAKLNQYTTLSAEWMQQEGKRTGILEIIFRPAATFCKMYLFKRGFLDGMEGFLLACCSASHVFFKYAKLWHLSNGKS